MRRHQSQCKDIAITARAAYCLTFASNATKHGTKSAGWVLEYSTICTLAAAYPLCLLLALLSICYFCAGPTGTARMMHAHLLARHQIGSHILQTVSCCARVPHLSRILEKVRVSKPDRDETHGPRCSPGLSAGDCDCIFWLNPAMKPLVLLHSAITHWTHQVIPYQDLQLVVGTMSQP